MTAIILISNEGIRIFFWSARLFECLAYLVSRKLENLILLGGFGKSMFSTTGFFGLLNHANRMLVKIFFKTRAFGNRWSQPTYFFSLAKGLKKKIEDKRKDRHQIDNLLPKARVLRFFFRNMRFG